jgi:predicted RNase H-like nuclease (RuvC/YqgF family)
MVHRTSTHQTTRDQYNQRLISLSNKNLELESSIHRVQKEYEKLEEKVSRQEIQISELRRLVRSFQSDKDDNDTCEESTDRIVALTFQVEKLQRQLIEVSQRKLTAAPSQGLRILEAATPIAKNEEGFESRIQDLSTLTSDNHFQANSIKGRCNTCIQYDELVNNLEVELKEFRNKNEALERSVKTLKSKNIEREVRSMTSLRQMRKQIDMLEHERKRRQEIHTSLEERVSILEAEKEIDWNEIQELVMKCNNLTTEIRHNTSFGESYDSSDHQNSLLFDVQSVASTGEKPDWSLLPSRIHRERIHARRMNSCMPSETKRKGLENDITRIGSGSDCSDTEASTVSQLSSDVCLY